MYGPEGWPVSKKSVGLKNKLSKMYIKYKVGDMDPKGGSMYVPGGWLVSQKNCRTKKKPINEKNKVKKRNAFRISS